jgi:hypothetical protein
MNPAELRDYARKEIDELRPEPAGPELELWREEWWGAIVLLAGLADDNAELLSAAANEVADMWASHVQFLSAQAPTGPTCPLRSDRRVTRALSHIDTGLPTVLARTLRAETHRRVGLQASIHGDESPASGRGHPHDALTSAVQADPSDGHAVRLGSRRRTTPPVPTITTPAMTSQPMLVPVNARAPSPVAAAAPPAKGAGSNDICLPFSLCEWLLRASWWITSGARCAPSF